MKTFKRLLLAEISIDKDTPDDQLRSYTDHLRIVSVQKGTDALSMLGVRTNLLNTTSSGIVCSMNGDSRYKVYRFVGDALPSGKNNLIQSSIIRGFEDISHNDFKCLKKWALLREVMDLLDSPKVWCVDCVPYGGLKVNCSLCEKGKKEYYLDVMSIVCYCISLKVQDSSGIKQAINKFFLTV